MDADKVGFAVQIDARRDDLDRLGGCGWIKRGGEDKVASVDSGKLKDQYGRAALTDMEDGQVAQKARSPSDQSPSRSTRWFQLWIASRFSSEKRFMRSVFTARSTAARAMATGSRP